MMMPVCSVSSAAFFIAVSFFFKLKVFFGESCEMSYSASGFKRIQHHALNVWTEEKGSFGLVAATIWLAVTTWTVWCLQSHLVCITYHSSPLCVPRGEVPGTAEHPQSSLECMCHDGINPQPWLMLYIYSHPSEHCHHNSQKHGFNLERLELMFGSPGTYNLLEGPSSVSSHVAVSHKELIFELESLSFCCPRSSLTAPKRDRVWCVFWRPAALSTLRPQHWHYGSQMPQGDSGAVGCRREGWVTAKKGDRQSKRD